jgi:hypothetical protein
MVKSKMVMAAGHEEECGRRPNAPLPVPRVVRKAMAAARKAFEWIGVFCVAAILALCISPEVRGSATQWKANLWSALGLDGEALAASERVDFAAAEEPRIGKPVVLAPANNNVATYLARRYHVADGAVRVMVAAAQEAGREHQVDPLLILAVVAVESSMNPFAQSPVGATGLMQVMPDLHSGKFYDWGVERSPLDPVANIRVGSQILADLIRRGGSVERGLQLYVGAGNAPDDGGYGNRVLGELAHLRMAASGSVAAALSAALRSDVHAPIDSPAALTDTEPVESPAGDPRKPDPA